MGWLGRLLRGGSDELGWDDLVRGVTAAVARLSRYADRGRISFPPDVVVEIEVEEASLAIARGFVQRADFDRQVREALANRCDCGLDALPLCEYRVSSGTRTRITAEPGSPRIWVFDVEGGDAAGRALVMPSGSKEASFGRGDWHGADRRVPNDLVVCQETAFVSRRAGRVRVVGHHIEIEALDQGDALVVRRANGEAIRPARTAKGCVAAREGDTIELGEGQSLVRLRVRRAVVGERDGGGHG